MGDACQAEIDRLSAVALRVSPPSSHGALGLAQSRASQDNAQPAEVSASVPQARPIIPLSEANNHEGESLSPAVATGTAATATTAATTAAATIGAAADSLNAAPHPGFRAVTKDGRGILNPLEVLSLPVRASAAETQPDINHECRSASVSQSGDPDIGSKAQAHLPELHTALGSVQGPRASPEEAGHTYLDSGSVYVDALEEGSTQPTSQYSDALTSPPPGSSQQLLEEDNEAPSGGTNTLGPSALAEAMLESASPVKLTMESIQDPGVDQEGARVGEEQAGVTAVGPKTCDTAVGAAVHVVSGHSEGRERRTGAIDADALQLRLSAGSSQGPSQAERQAASQDSGRVADQNASRDAGGQPTGSERLVCPSNLMCAANRTAQIIVLGCWPTVNSRFLMTCNDS